MGDTTARWLGRITLNPIKHLDPIGTIMLLLFGFGWAKPVPVNFSNLRDYRKGMILVSAAGITANIILAFLALLIIRMGIFSPWGIMTDILSVFARINMILAAFNLIPIPPLDGAKILYAILPQRLADFKLRYERSGPLILFGLVILDNLFGVGIFSGIFQLILGVIFKILS